MTAAGDMGAEVGCKASGRASPTGGAKANGPEGACLGVSMSAAGAAGPPAHVMHAEPAHGHLVGIEHRSVAMVPQTTMVPETHMSARAVTCPR